MSEIQISVIIPSYKPQCYLWECLDSLERQTLEKHSFEVILILNGCDQPYSKDIRNYINKSTLNFKFIQLDQGGVSNARNKGLEIASGKYVTFIDDDDYISTCYLERMLQSADGKSLVLTDANAFIDGTTDIIETYGPHAAFKKCAAINDQSLLHARSILNGPCMKLLHRSFIQDAKFDTKFANGEDELFVFEISKNFKCIKYAQSDAIYYRRLRQNSALVNNNSRKYLLKNVLNLIIALSNRYFKNPFRYNLLFFLSRLIAQFKCIIIYWK
jgi:glycosyltransferase involved in cell wall biosynthesis